MKLEGQGILSNTTLRNIRALTYLGGVICLSHILGISVADILVGMIESASGVKILAANIEDVTIYLLSFLIIIVSVGWWADFKLWRDGPWLDGAYPCKAIRTVLRNISSKLDALDLSEKDEEVIKAVKKVTGTYEKQIKGILDKNIRSIWNTSIYVVIILIAQFFILPLGLGIASLIILL